MTVVELVDHLGYRSNVPGHRSFGLLAIVRQDSGDDLFVVGQSLPFGLEVVCSTQLHAQKVGLGCREEPVQFPVTRDMLKQPVKSVSRACEFIGVT